MHDAGSELKFVLNPVIDERSGGARLDSSLGDCLRNLVNETRVEWGRDNVFGTEGESFALISASDFIWNWLTGELSESCSSGHLHRLIDLTSTSVQGGTEQEWETHYVVDLVWVIRPARRNNSVLTDCLGSIGFNLRFGICHSKYNRCVSHLSKILRPEGAGRRDSNEDICANEGFLEGTLFCIIGELLFLRVHAFCSALKDNTFCITDNNVLF